MDNSLELKLALTVMLSIIRIHSEADFKCKSYNITQAASSDDVHDVISDSDGYPHTRMPSRSVAGTSRSDFDIAGRSRSVRIPDRYQIFDYRIHKLVG